MLQAIALALMMVGLLVVLLGTIACVHWARGRRPRGRHGERRPGEGRRRVQQRREMQSSLQLLPVLVVLPNKQTIALGLPS